MVCGGILFVSPIFFKAYVGLCGVFTKCLARLVDLVGSPSLRHSRALQAASATGGSPEKNENTGFPLSLE